MMAVLVNRPAFVDINIGKGRLQGEADPLSRGPRLYSFCAGSWTE